MRWSSKAALLGVLSVVVLSAAVGVTPAMAAPISGTGQDVQGDQQPFAPNPYWPAVMRDLRSFQASYDNATGLVEATLRFWDNRATEYGYPWFHATADLGRYRNGGCDTTSPGALHTRFETPDDRPGPSGSATGQLAGEGLTVAGTTALDYGDSTYRAWTYRLEHRVLASQGYNCVDNIAVHNYDGSEDYAKGFCLGSNGSSSCPPVVSERPVAPTNVRAAVSGNTVSLTWDATRHSNFSHFAVRRGTDPNSDPAGWTRLGPSFTTNTAVDSGLAPGTYYYYVTQVTRGGRVSDRSAVVSAVVRPA